MNNGKKRKQPPRTSTAATNAFTPDQIKAIEEATNALRKGFPWLKARPEARLVAYRATFPRSTARDKQDDPLLRRIWFITQTPCDDVELTRLAIVETTNRIVAPQDPKEEELITKELEKDEPPGSAYRLVDELGKMASELCKLSNLGTPFRPKTDREFFSRIADDLKYLETYKPTAGDYAVEALQNAFVGLMQSKYDWGKKGLPTKGEVTAMAKARLKQSGKKFDFSKAYWSELLQMAGFGDWLPAGRAGRPSKASLDENVKAEREYKSLCAQAVNEIYGGDIIRARDSLKAAYGNRAEYRKSEEDSLRGVQPGSEEESE